MHQPRPYGLHAIGLPLTERDEAFVASVAKRITNLKDISEVDSLKMVYDLPDGGYVIVQDMGGNFRVISHKPIHGKDPIFDGVETDYIPMLFSGVVTKDTVFAGEPVELRLTEQARLRLVNYNYLEAKPPKDIGLQRFRINYSQYFQEFKPNASTAVLRTQYSQLRPTWYSGAMAEVMQIVGGYGRQDFANLPDENTNIFERAQFLLPKEWLDRVNSELLGLRLPAYTGLPPADGTFQFDYKFNKTHAVGFDDKDRPWLLQIASNGVWAMPLPIVPATRTNAFRHYMQLMGDDEILAILDRFGGMPSGESFPNVMSFEAWRRAGVVIKICDSSDFYHHIAYSSACGWSLNSRGTEGYNTCYDYYDDEGLGYGLTYKLSLNLVSTDQYYGAEPVDLVDTGPIADKVRLYLRQLIPTLGVTNDDRAILYKLRRAKSGDIYQRALGRKGSEDRDYWHNLEMTPIATHTGRVSEVYRGYLYNGAKFQYQPQIKFPEPLMGGCISHDFLPLENGRFKKKYPNSDTVMFAYYIGDSLKVVKYFIDHDSFKREVIGNFEQYMTVGSWSQLESSGSTVVQGNFYSSDIDDRELVSDSTIETTIVGEDKGFDTQPYFSFDAPFAMWGTLYRNRYYTHKVDTVSIREKSISVSICIPYLCRNAIINAKKVSTPYKTTGSGLSLNAIQDPSSYRYWTYDKTWAWSGGGGGNAPQKGTPYPVDGNPVWVEQRRYNPTPANNFADNGDWVGGLPADYGWLIHPDSNVWQLNGGGGPPTVGTYSYSSGNQPEEKGSIKLSIDGQPNLVNQNVPSNRYFISSPTEFGDVFYRDACKIVFGETEYRNVSEPSASAPRAKWGYTRLVDNKSAHHFIGVINE